VPTYPKLALNNEWEGTVKVNVTVSSTGKPIQVTVISSSGYETLDNSFIRAIQNSYQFKPKRVMGNNVVGVITLSYSFTLGGQK
ncbi:MAG: energy transducer TonB, partial [Candidatus Margulisiibacteriota bacterium]